jgi:hypothetical protein
LSTAGIAAEVRQSISVRLYEYLGTAVKGSQTIGRPTESISMTTILNGVSFSTILGATTEKSATMGSALTLKAATLQSIKRVQYTQLWVFMMVFILCCLAMRSVMG